MSDPVLFAAKFLLIVTPIVYAAVRSAGYIIGRYTKDSDFETHKGMPPWLK